jgi:hypothetical protein
MLRIQVGEHGIHDRVKSSVVVVVVAVVLERQITASIHDDFVFLVCW